MEVLKRLIVEGVDVFRLNMAHGTREEHQTLVQRIRQASHEMNLAVGILVDLAGPKIRTGKLFQEPLTLEPNATVTFVRGQEAKQADHLTCTYEFLIDELKAGDQVMLTDGLVRLEVESQSKEQAVCKVIDGGTIRSRQGVNLPGVDLGIPALLDRDRDNAAWAAKNQVEFVSLSFVRTAAEVNELKQLIRGKGCQAMIIAKIEKREALENLHSIVEAADGVMVARGDLGVEIEIEKTPRAQKRIIKSCSKLGKPVIVATQMLESMHHNRRPTRAEVSDVANAILDGADACMLSGETAIGDHPIESVIMMQKIQAETELALAGRPSRTLSPEKLQQQGVSEAVVLGAALIARRVEAKLVVLATTDGQTAIAKSKQRDFIPTLALTTSSKIMNRMSLLWGVAPIQVDRLDIESLRTWIEDWARDEVSLSSGDRIVFVADTEVLPGVHDTVMVWGVA